MENDEVFEENIETVLSNDEVDEIQEIIEEKTTDTQEINGATQLSTDEILAITEISNKIDKLDSNFGQLNTTCFLLLSLISFTLFVKVILYTFKDFS